MIMTTQKLSFFITLILLATFISTIITANSLSTTPYDCTGPGVLFNNEGSCYCLPPEDNFFGPNCTTSYNIPFNTLLWRFNKNNIVQQSSNHPPDLLPLPFDFTYFIKINNIPHPPPSPISTKPSSSSQQPVDYRIVLVPAWLTYDGTNRVIHADFEKYLLNPGGVSFQESQNNPENTAYNNPQYFSNSACGGVYPGDNNNIFPTQLYRLGILYEGEDVVFPLVNHLGQYKENQKVLYLFTKPFNIICIDGRARYAQLTKINQGVIHTYLYGNLQHRNILAYQPGIARFDPYPLTQASDYIWDWSTLREISNLLDIDNIIDQTGMLCTTEIIGSKIYGYFGPGCIFKYETLQITPDTTYAEDQYIPMLFQIANLELADQIFNGDTENLLTNWKVNFYIHLNVDDIQLNDPGDINTGIGALELLNWGRDEFQQLEIQEKFISSNLITKQAYINRKVELQIVTVYTCTTSTMNEPPKQRVHLHRHTNIELYKINPVDYINAIVTVNTLGIPSGNDSSNIPLSSSPPSTNTYPSALSNYIHSAVIYFYSKINSNTRRTIQNGWLPCGPGAVGLNAPFTAWLNSPVDIFTETYPQPCICTTTDDNYEWFGPFCTYFIPKSNLLAIPTRLKHGKPFILKLFSHNSNLRYIKSTSTMRFCTRQCLIRFLITRPSDNTILDARPPETCARVPSIYDGDYAGMHGYELLIQPHVHFDTFYTTLGQTLYDEFYPEIDALLNRPTNDPTSTTYGLDMKIVIDFWSPNGTQQKEIKTIKLYNPISVSHETQRGVGAAEADESIPKVCLPPYIGSGCISRMATNLDRLTRNWQLHPYFTGILQHFGDLTGDLFATPPASSWRLGNLSIGESLQFIFRTYNSTLSTPEQTPIIPSTETIPPPNTTPIYAQPQTPAVSNSGWIYGTVYFTIPPPGLDGSIQRVARQTAETAEEVPYFWIYTIENDPDFTVIWSQLVQAMPLQYDNISNPGIVLSDECPKHHGEKRIIQVQQQDQTNIAKAICFCNIQTITNAEYQQQQQQQSNYNDNDFITSSLNTDVIWDNNSNDIYQQTLYFGQYCQYSLKLGYNNQQPQLINGQHGLIFNIQWDMRYEMEHVVWSYFIQHGGNINNNYLENNKHIIMKYLSNYFSFTLLRNINIKQQRILQDNNTIQELEWSGISIPLGFKLNPSTQQIKKYQFLTLIEQANKYMKNFNPFTTTNTPTQPPQQYIQEILVWVETSIDYNYDLGGAKFSLWLANTQNLQISFDNTISQSSNQQGGEENLDNNNNNNNIANTPTLEFNYPLLYKKNMALADYNNMYSPVYAQNPGDLYICGRDENAYLLELFESVQSSPSSLLDQPVPWVDFISFYQNLTDMGYYYYDVGYLINYASTDMNGQNKNAKDLSSLQLLYENNYKSNILRSIAYAQSDLIYIQTDSYHYNSPFNLEPRQMGYTFTSPHFCPILQTSNNYHQLVLRTSQLPLQQPVAYTSDLPLSHCPQVGRFGSTCQYGIRIRSNSIILGQRELQMPLKQLHYDAIRTPGNTIYAYLLQGGVLNYYFDHPPEYFYINNIQQQQNNNNIDDNNIKIGITEYSSSIIPITGCKIWFWTEWSPDTFDKYYVGDCSATLPQLKTVTNNNNPDDPNLQLPTHQTITIPHNIQQGQYYLIVEYIGTNEVFIKPANQQIYDEYINSPPPSSYSTTLKPTYYNLTPRPVYILEPTTQQQEIGDVCPKFTDARPVPIERNISPNCFYYVQREIDYNSNSNNNENNIFSQYHNDIKNLPFINWLLNRYIYEHEPDVQYQVLVNTLDINANNKISIPCSYESSSPTNIQQPNDLTTCSTSILNTNGTIITTQVYSPGVYTEEDHNLEIGLFYVFDFEKNNYILNQQNTITTTFNVPEAFVNRGPERKYTSTEIGQLEHVPLPITILTQQQYMIELARLLSFEQVQNIFWCFHDKIKNLNITKFLLNPYSIPYTSISYAPGDRPFQPQSGNINEYCECLEDVPYCRMQQCPPFSKRNYTSWYYQNNNPNTQPYPPYDVNNIPYRSLNYDRLPQCECEPGHYSIYADENGNVNNDIYNINQQQQQGQRSGYYPGELVQCIQLYNPTYCPNINERLYYHRYSNWINPYTSNTQPRGRNLRSDKLLSSPHFGNYASCEHTTWLSFTWRPTQIKNNYASLINTSTTTTNSNNNSTTMMRTKDIMNSIGTYRIWQPEERSFYIYNASRLEVSTWWSNFQSNAFYETMWDSMWPSWPYHQLPIPPPQVFPNNALNSEMPSSLLSMNSLNVVIDNNNNNENDNNNKKNSNQQQQQQFNNILQSSSSNTNTYQSHPYWHPSGSTILQAYNEYNLDEMSFFFKLNPSFFAFYKIDTFKQVSFAVDDSQPINNGNGNGGTDGDVYFNTTGPNGHHFFIDLQYYPEISPGVYSKRPISLWSSHNLNKTSKHVMGLISGDGVLGNIALHPLYQPRVNITIDSTYYSQNVSHSKIADNQRITVDMISTHNLINLIADLDDILNDVLQNGNTSTYINTQPSITTIEQLDVLINSNNTINTSIPEDLYFYIQNLDITHIPRPRDIDLPNDVNDPWEGTYPFETNPPLTFNPNQTLSTCFWSIYVQDRSHFIPIATTQPFALQFRTGCDGSRDGGGNNGTSGNAEIALRCNPLNDTTTGLLSDNTNGATQKYHVVYLQGQEEKNIRFIEDEEQEGEILKEIRNNIITKDNNVNSNNTTNSINITHKDIDNNTISLSISSLFNIFEPQQQQEQQIQQQKQYPFCNALSGKCFYPCMSYCDIEGTEYCESTPYKPTCHCKSAYTGVKCNILLKCKDSDVSFGILPCMNGGWYPINEMDPKSPLLPALPLPTTPTITVTPSQITLLDTNENKNTNFVISKNNNNQNIKDKQEEETHERYEELNCIYDKGCVCPIDSFWLGNMRGERCTKCMLQCQNQGRPTPQCKSCYCRAGYNGKTCECSSLTGVITIPGFISDILLLWLQEQLINELQQPQQHQQSINNLQNSKQKTKSTSTIENFDILQNNNTNNINNNNTTSHYQKQILDTTYSRMLYVFKTLLLDTMGINNNNNNNNNNNPAENNNMNPLDNNHHNNNFINEELKLDDFDIELNPDVVTLDIIRYKYNNHTTNIDNDDADDASNNSTDSNNDNYYYDDDDDIDNRNDNLMSSSFINNNNNLDDNETIVKNNDVYNNNNNEFITFPSKLLSLSNKNNKNSHSKSITSSSTSTSTSSPSPLICPIIIKEEYYLNSTSIKITINYGCPQHAPHLQRNDIISAWSRLIDQFTFYLSQPQHREIFNYFYYTSSSTASGHLNDNNNTNSEVITIPPDNTNNNSSCPIYTSNNTIININDDDDNSTLLIPIILPPQNTQPIQPTPATLTGDDNSDDDDGDSSDANNAGYNITFHLTTTTTLLSFIIIIISIIL